MSETLNPEEMTRTVASSDAVAANGGAPHHTRIADLLDDVVVGAPAVAPDPNGAAGAHPAPAKPAPPASVASFFTPLPEPTTPAPVAPPTSAAAPSMPAPVAPFLAPAAEDRVTLPGERLMSAPRRPATDLPPFLAPPPAADAPAAPILAPAAPVVAPDDPASTALIPVEEEQDEAPAVNQIVNIKGRSDGITVEVGRGSWHEILAALTSRLEQSAGFFRSGSVALDVGPRPVVEDELRQFASVLTNFEMKLGVVRTSSERTFQAALATGMTATLESPEGAPVAAAAPAATNTDTASYFVYRGYLRSGHRLRRKENILVIGDINPGAEVISEGDILVWGRLRGVVHAGVGGNRRAIIAALDLEPTQMRIADVTTIGPDPKPGQPGRFFWRKSQHKRPEIARLAQNEIVLEEWDAARPGGLVSLRRGAG